MAWQPSESGLPLIEQLYTPRGSQGYGLDTYEVTDTISDYKDYRNTVRLQAYRIATLE